MRTTHEVRRARSRVLASTISALLGSTGVSGMAFAQQEPGAPEGASALEEITVTGSRIVRQDFEANSPIVTVGEELFGQTGTAALETQLNRLPQFTPTLDNPTQGGDIQPNARNTPGSASISLRGLGANRSLVLINGRRGTPSNSSMVVDINTIPAAAVERVEAISGGASATYGADAMAGVVNFIMRNNFEGLEINVQTSLTEESDNFESQVSAIMGGNLADGRGNVSLAMSANKRNAAYQRDRSWYRDLWADPTIGGTQFFGPFSGFDTGGTNLPDVDVLNQVINGASFTESPANTPIYLDFSGNAWSGTNAAGVPGASGAQFVDGQQFVELANGQIGTNNVDNLLILPLQRYNVFGQSNYAINDWAGVFAQGYFSRTTTNTVQEPVPITSGWSVNIDPTINRDVIPADMLAILDSREDPDAEFALRGLLPFNRTSTTDVNTYNLTFGFDGDIPTSDWTWEIFVQRGESETTVLQEGFTSLQRLRAVMQSPNFGAGFEQSGNQGAPDFGFGASTATCESGLNPFDWDATTQDCLDAVRADISTKQVMQQTIWETNLQGGVVDLPAGQMRAAVGGSFRENDYRFENDTLVTQGASFLEQASGLYPAASSAGKINVWEVYAEVLIPILGDLPGVQRLDLELGGRYSDYNTTGSSTTFKALADWRVNDAFRMRGGYNRAERAPNVAELYLAAEQTFAFAAGGDVCSTQNGQAWSANSNVNPENWQNVALLCGELMRASGNPAADELYYGVTSEQVAAGVAPTNPQGSGGSFLFPTTVGNSTLETEKADTWTIGMVFNSWSDRPALSDLRLSIDYYNIAVSDAIGEQSADIVMRQCTDVAFNPNFDPNSPFCDGFRRNATGTIGDLQRTFFNNGRFRTSGIDLQVNWGMAAGPGYVSANSIINRLLSMRSSELDVIPTVDYSGTFGPNQNGLNGSSYDYRLLTTVNYSLDRLNFGVRWQHLPSIDVQDAAVNSETTVRGAPSYNLFDLTGGFQLTSEISLRFGVENVFDKAPPLVNRNPAAELPNLPGGNFNTNNYDTNGRRFYLGATARF